MSVYVKEGYSKRGYDIIYSINVVAKYLWGGKTYDKEKVK